MELKWYPDPQQLVFAYTVKDDGGQSHAEQLLDLSATNNAGAVATYDLRTRGLVVGPR